MLFDSEDESDPELPALLAGVSSFMHFSSSAPVIPEHFAEELLPALGALAGALDEAGAEVLPPEALSLELPVVALPDVLGLAALAPLLALPVVLSVVALLAPGLLLLPVVLCAQAADAVATKAAVTAALMNVRFMKDPLGLGWGLRETPRKNNAPRAKPDGGCAKP